MNQSPSLSVDTPVDIQVKEALLEDTFKLLSFTSSTPQQGSKFWRIFPSQRIGEKFAKLFVFPFPEEMLTDGNFLAANEKENLKDAIKK